MANTALSQQGANLPLVLQWREPENPLPLRCVRHPGRRRGEALGLQAPPWLDTGPVGQPFDFCGHVRRLCGDIVERCEELAHINTSRLLFAVTQARSGRRHGLQARVTPLRFRHGRLTRRRGDGAYQVQRFFVDDHEMLYLVTFCLPRFLDADFDDKFVTLFHELYHISPAFEGDLRRHDGRYALHSHSKRIYDAHMAGMAREYLASRPDPALYSFLRVSFAQLVHRHGSVIGIVVPRPRLIPVCDTAARQDG
jgi:hypothetical protein